MNANDKKIAEEIQNKIENCLNKLSGEYEPNIVFVAFLKEFCSIYGLHKREYPSESFKGLIKSLKHCMDEEGIDLWLELTID